MIQPKISVVTVCYNAVNDIEKTILSVINQTYPNIEYLIIDGGSTDGTMDIVNKYKDKIDVIVSEPDKGIYDAMNKGIDRATGEWINFMNAGDCFFEKETVNSVFTNIAPSEVDVIYGHAISVRGVNENMVWAYDKSTKLIPPAYRHGASFVYRKVHLQYKFRLDKIKDFGYGLDYDCICRMYRDGKHFRFVDKVIMRFLEEGTSNHYFKNLWMRNLIEHDGQSNLTSILDFLFFLLCGFKRKYEKNKKYGKEILSGTI